MIVRRAVAAVALIAGSTVACGTSEPSNNVLVLPLRTVDVGPNGACGGVGLDAVLRGSPTDPEVAWLEARPGGVGPPPGQRIHVVWPNGYRAVFAPTLEIVNYSGMIVLRAGDPVNGACVRPEPNLLLLMPPFS